MSAEEASERLPGLGSPSRGGSSSECVRDASSLAEAEAREGRLGRLDGRRLGDRVRGRSGRSSFRVVVHVDDVVVRVRVLDRVVLGSIVVRRATEPQAWRHDRTRVGEVSMGRVEVARC